MDWVNLIVFAYGYFGSKICETFASTLYLLFHITMTFFTLMVEKVLTLNWLFSDDIFDSADCSINDIVSIHNAEIGADAFSRKIPLSRGTRRLKKLQTKLFWCAP